MLSIGKLAAGQARYYLDQAEVRVDVVASVGDGIEDYYVGGSEPRGEWLGAGVRRLALGGPVDGDALRRVLAGLDPWSGAPLRTSRSPVRVAAFDLTFSAPKGVSVLFGVGGGDVASVVRRAHVAAVTEAVGYLERAAAAVRRGAGGIRVQRADGLVAAAFRHRSSRAGDPQLHTHVLVANLARGRDGRWSALDARPLYAHARAASFVYQAVLRGELTRTLGIEWSPVREGIADVAGVPTEVLRAFSRRRAEIESALVERGTSGARAAEAAALATRRAKDRTLAPDRLVAAWRERAASLGFGRAQVEWLLNVVPSRTPTDAEWTALEDSLAAPTGLTRRRSSFARRDLIQGVCERLPAGATIDARAIEAAADRFLRSHRAVPLIPDRAGGAEGEAFRRRDGVRISILGDELRYSTPELLAVEQQLIDRARRLRAAGVGVADRAVVDALIAARPGLTAEQRAMIQRLCGDGAGIAVVAGKAGTGKTYALAAAREAWEAAGLPVFGVAVARRAARELEAGAGIPSTSVAALLADLERRDDALPVGVVLVVDEAGMIATRALATLAASVERVGGRLVLVGDHRQLPELEAGGAFRGLARRGPTVELHENRRQRNAWERAALDHLRAGRVSDALRLYGAHDRIVVEPDAERARERIVRDWWTHRDPDDSVMIAQRRDEVAELNVRARRLMRDAGALGGRELLLPGGGFAVGDRIVVKRNDLRLRINNGDRGQVVSVDLVGTRLGIVCGDRFVTLGPDFLLDRTARGDPTLLHGYAITAHVAQGLTAERAFVLGGEGISSEIAYTALSRGRESNHLYLAAREQNARVEFAPGDPKPPNAMERLAAGLSRSTAEPLAIDIGRSTTEDHDDVARARIAAERALRTAAARRVALERRGLQWLPWRRAALEEARGAEWQAVNRVADMRRRENDHRRARDPARFAEGSEPGARARERPAQRRAARERLRDRDFGIDL